MVGVGLCQVPVSYLVVYLCYRFKLLRADTAPYHYWLQNLLFFFLVLISVRALRFTLILKIYFFNEVYNFDALRASSEHIYLIQKVRVNGLYRNCVVSSEVINLISIFLILNDL